MEKYIMEITKLCEILGWNVAVPTGGGELDNGQVHGLVIGEEAYVNYVLKHLE